jgi:penicillin-insensitive murein endopeptidase
MCRTARSSDKPWLQKIRPLYGHNTHFHVRLKCPAGSRNCQTQTPSVAELSKGGDGCDETLNWWVTTYLEQLKNPPKPSKKPKGPRKKTPREYTMADLPQQCSAVLASR